MQHGLLLKKRARTLRREMTEAERRLWGLIRDRRLGGAKFRRQVPMGPFIADFVSFEHRLVIEADGSQHADAPRDARRDAWLRANGFRVLRFWNIDILARPASVAEAILAAIGDAGSGR